jgi:hypothetical protein
LTNGCLCRKGSSGLLGAFLTIFPFYPEWRLFDEHHHDLCIRCRGNHWPRADSRNPFAAGSSQFALPLDLVSSSIQPIDLQFLLVPSGVVFMGARHKLNQAHLLGAVAIAAIAGLLTESWAVFFIAAAILLGGAICAGDIRFDSRRRK